MNVFISSGGLRRLWGWSPLQWAALWRVQSINLLPVSCVTHHALPHILAVSSGPAPPAHPRPPSPLQCRRLRPKVLNHSWAGAWRSSQRWWSESLCSSSHLCLQGETSGISAETDNRTAKAEDGFYDQPCFPMKLVPLLPIELFAL